MARLVPWAVVAAVLSGVTANVLRLRGDVSLAGPSLAAQVLEIAAGAALIVVGGTAGRGAGPGAGRGADRGAGRGAGRWLLVATGASWLIAEWASPASPDAVAFTLGLVVVLAPVPLVLASRWRRPVPLVSGALLAVVVLLGLTGAVSGGPVAAAAASPRDAGCTDCARDLIALAHDVPASAGLGRLGEQFTVAAGVIAMIWLVAGVLAARRRGALFDVAAPDGALFEVAAPDVAVTAFAVAAGAQAAAVLGGGPADPAGYGARAAASAILLVLSAVLARPALRAARARRLVARAAVALAEDPAGGAAGALAAVLGDPGLRVAYQGPDGAWRDHRGQPVVLPDRDVTMVTDAGQVVAALLHRRPARIDQASVTGAVSAARLLLDAERIESGARARVADLRAARRRVVDAADAARSSLERDLHDGAQQRLVALRYALGLAGARAARQPEPALAARLSDADRAAEQALADLRELAHGISAAPLAVAGLADAVRSAAERAPGAVTILELPAERLPDQVERAAYRFIADALREMGPSATVAVRRAGRDVIVEITGVLVAAESVAGLTDRVAAAGGQLQQAAHDGHQWLIAVLPCE